MDFLRSTASLYTLDIRQFCFVGIFFSFIDFNITLASIIPLMQLDLSSLLQRFRTAVINWVFIDRSQLIGQSTGFWLYKNSLIAYSMSARLQWWMAKVWPFKIPTVNNPLQPIMTFPSLFCFHFQSGLSLFVLYKTITARLLRPHNCSKVSVDNTKCSNYVLQQISSREHRLCHIVPEDQAQ